MHINETKEKRNEERKVREVACTEIKYKKTAIKEENLRDMTCMEVK
jgi:hypothetical protein